MDSFDYQSVNFNNTSRPQGVDKALAHMEAMYAPAQWRVPDDFAQESHVRRCLRELMSKNADSSSGAVLSRMGMPTNDVVISKLGEDAVVQMVLDRIAQLELCEHEDDAKYLADPVKIFVKREAHKRAKALLKRWRLIWGVSLIDQIIDRVIYGEVCDRLLENCEEIPSKPGYNFKNGGVDNLVRKYNNESKKWVSFDAKSFDMSVPGWALDAVREFYGLLCITPHGTSQWKRWERLSSLREVAAQYGSFCFSNGVVCRKTKPGLVLSGRFTTISTNSLLVVLFRVLNDVQRCITPSDKEIIAMGDDTVQDEIDDPKEFVRWLKETCGIEFTIESVQGKFVDQNFCSMEFKLLESGIYVPVPLNLQKNLYELCHVEARKCKDPNVLYDNLGSALYSFCIEYAFHDVFPILHGLLAGLYGGVKFRSAKTIRRIVTGWESA